MMVLAGSTASPDALPPFCSSQSPLGVSTFAGKSIKRVVCIPQKNNPSVVILNFVVA